MQEKARSAHSAWLTLVLFYSLLSLCNFYHFLGYKSLKFKKMLIPRSQLACKYVAQRISAINQQLKDISNCWIK